METTIPTLTFGLGTDAWGPHPPCLLAIDIEERQGPALRHTYALLSLVGSPQQLTDGAGVLTLALRSRTPLTLVTLYPDGRQSTTMAGLITQVHMTGRGHIRPGNVQDAAMLPAFMHDETHTLRCMVLLSPASLDHSLSRPRD